MKNFKKKSPHDHTQKHPGEKGLTGIISLTAKGIGYLEAEGFREDIEITNEDLNTALNKDEVEVSVGKKAPRGRRTTGKVLKILKRAKTNFVGVLDQKDSKFYLIADDKKVYRDILITEGINKNAKTGLKAFVEMKNWTDPTKSPEGKLLKLLGEKGLHEVEMESIVLEKGFATSFPNGVEHEATIIQKEKGAITAEEIAKRRDFRNVLTFTIDPKTAKDFDDAISFRIIHPGRYEVGVHIADVSHYVTVGTQMDTEAVKRGFSVYLVDRTIPMLPEVLSNHLCSLNPNEDKLSFSAVFEIEETPHSYKVTKRWFGKTIINSNKRFTYEEAAGILKARQGLHFEELNKLNVMAEYLRKERMKKGAIDFDQDEVEFELDKDGKPLRIYKKERLPTHKLVEEFMLLANREVAEVVFKAGKQAGKTNLFIYRIHDLPDKEKIMELSIFLKALGHELPLHDGTVKASDLQKLFKQIEGQAEEPLIRTAAVRSMAKAVYSTRNIGHYGLAFEYYTHFTSPIRRYADLLVHRFLQKYLEHKPLGTEEMSKFQKIAYALTEKEIAAAEAERNSKKYKQVEYMQNHVGETFDGIVSGVTEWGIYVEEKNTRSEGMVPLRSIGDDYYKLDSKRYAIVGEKTKKKFSLGDKVTIKLVGVDNERRQLEFALVK